MTSKPLDHSFPKDSFDRFGDDLSQLVLKYLSLEDRFRFECVSKQWQKVVYQTQQELFIEYDLCKKWVVSESLDLNYLKTILTNKCPNIRAIKLYNYRMTAFTIYGIMDSLVEWCPNMRSFDGHSRGGEYYTDLYGLIDRIVVFGELRHLSIDCTNEYFHIYGNINPYPDVMNKLANSCQHIQSLELYIVFDDNVLMAILSGLKLFGQLSRLRLRLYGLYRCGNQISVKPLLECRPLQYVWLDCHQDVDIKDVDQLRRQVRRVTITKNLHKFMDSNNCLNFN